MTPKSIDPSSHPDKDVRAALKKLVGFGWRLTNQGHWGRVFCPCGPDCPGAATYVSGSPKAGGKAEARRLERFARKCPETKKKMGKR